MDTNQSDKEIKTEQEANEFTQENGERQGFSSPKVTTPKPPVWSEIRNATNISNNN